MLSRVFLAMLLAVLWAGCRDYVRTAPAPSEVVGSYSLNRAQAEPMLRRMGYSQFNARLTLKADGSFAGENIPGCCLHGSDESAFKLVPKLYTVSGNWQIRQSPSALPAVRLKIRSTQDGPFVPGPPQDGAIPTEVAVPMLNSNPPSLAFQIFNGDFYDIVFIR